MMNQTAQIAGEKKLKLVVFRGILALSGHKVNLDVSRQLWMGHGYSGLCKTNRNIFSFSCVEIRENELYIRGDHDFSDKKYKEETKKSERVFDYRSQKRAEKGFAKHKKNLRDAATWVADNFKEKFR